MLTLGEVFPNFSAKTTIGNILFHEWLGNAWGILFSHPADFTPVCTTELSRLVNLTPEFAKRGVKVIALSIDTVESHVEWMKDIKSYAGDNAGGFPYPIIEDKDRRIALMLGMLDADELDSSGMPLTARAVFVVDPNKKFRLSMLYPATTGRNFNEILRTIDAMQLTDKYKVATPADWTVGQECMVLPTVSQEEASQLFQKGISTVELPSGKGYLRKTPHP